MKTQTRERRPSTKREESTPSDRKKARKVHKELSDRNIGYLRKDGTIRTIYVGNLRYTKKEFDIKDMFKSYGEVTYVRLVMDKATQQSQGIAFVQMTDNDNATKAVKALNGKEIDGRTLKVSFAKERPVSTKRPTPRRRS